MNALLNRPAAPDLPSLQFPPIEPWPHPIDGSLLLNDLASEFKRFLVLPQWAAETLALWTPHTYAFHLRDVTTYLGIESPEKRCGKTTLLTALSKLVNRPVVAANIGSPAFFRVIEALRPTLLIDESDTFLQNDELRGILNSGCARATAFVVRVTQALRHPAGAPLVYGFLTPPYGSRYGSIVQNHRILPRSLRVYGSKGGGLPSQGARRQGSLFRCPDWKAYC